MADSQVRTASQSSKSYQSSHNLNPDGLRSSFHGIIYQLRLCILFLQKALKTGYKFELYSEKNDAKKFDDVIFKYDKEDKYRFLQAKHKLDPADPARDKITMEKLCSDSNKEPFSLQQYFIAFRKISQNNNYKGKIQDFIICTNTDFTDTIKYGKSVSKHDNVDDLLNIGGGVCYKFVLSECSQIHKKLQSASDVKKLAKELYEIIKGKDKSIDLKRELFKAYHIPLMKEVLERIEKEKGYCIFQKNFISGTKISNNAKLLRNALEQEAINASDLLKQKKNTKLELRNCSDSNEQENRVKRDFWKNVKKVKSKVSTSFGHPKLAAEELTYTSNDEIKELNESPADFRNNPTLSDKSKELFNFKSSSNPKIELKLTKLNDLAKEVAQGFEELIRGASPNHIDLKFNKRPFSKYEDKKSYIKDRLPGYILVKAEEQNFLRFNLNFPEDNLPQDLRTFKTELWDLLNIVDSTEMKSFRFKVSSDLSNFFPEEDELYSKVSLPNDVVKDDEIREFFDKLVLAVNQPNEEELRNSIEVSWLEDLDDLTNQGDAEFIYNFVQSKMLDWLKKPKSIALTDEDNFFEQGRKKHQEIKTRLSYIEYTRDFKELNIKFTDHGLKEIKEFLSPKEQKKILVIKTTSKNLLLTKAKVHQVKPEIPWPLKVLLIAKESGISLQTLNQNDTLVIVCEKDTGYVKDFNSDLNHYLSRLNRKLILITCNDNISWFDYDCKQYKQIEDKTTFKDLSEIFVVTKLLRKEITFQGQRTRFASVLDIDDAILEDEFSNNLIQRLEEIMNPEVITEVVFNEDISVGDILPCFQDKNSRYCDPLHIDIRRGFNAQIIEENYLINLLATNNGTFAFNGDNITNHVREYIEQEFKKMILNEFNNDKQFFIIRSTNEFKEILKHNTNNVSWFDSFDGNFKVKYSDVLPKLKKYTKLTLIDNITDINDPVLILVGDPGIGKSTVLTTCSQELGSSSWVIRINLKEHDEYLKDCYVDNKDNLIKFLLKNIDVGRNNPITNSLLKYRINHQGRIILFLDEYDEISDESQNNVIDLITFMKTTKGRVWITTSTNEQRNIENALGIFSYSLRRFDNKEQTIFLEEFWARDLKTESNLIKDYVNVFAKHFRERFQSMGYGHLLGIPLQTRMIAEIFTEECQKYIHSKVCNVNRLGINNVYDLYTQLTHRQYNRHFKKKGYCNISNHDKRVLSESYTKNYGHVAIKTLIHNNEICKELLPLKNDDFEYDDLFKIGIIKKVEQNGIVKFIHQTYTEYFVAKYLIYVLGENSYEQMFKLLRNAFFEQHRLIRVFIESEILGEENLKEKWLSINKKDSFRKIVHCILNDSTGALIIRHSLPPSLTGRFVTDISNTDKLKRITRFKLHNETNEDDGVLSFNQQKDVLKIAAKLLKENGENVEFCCNVKDYFRTLGLLVQNIDVNKKQLIADKITVFQLELTFIHKKQLKRKNDEMKVTGAKKRRKSV